MKKRKRRRIARRLILFLVFAACVAAAVGCLPTVRAYLRVRHLERVTVPAFVQSALLDNSGARHGRRLTDFTGIVVHYVGNPNTTATGNRNYFNQPTTTVSAHFVIGLDGEILQCLPLYEQSVASNNRNRDTVSIEVCHPDDSGKFTDETYASLVTLTAWLCDIGSLDTDAIIRHYDVTGKECPRYFVQHPVAWERFLDAVQNARK